MPKEGKQAGEVVVWPPGAGCVPAVSQFLVMIPECTHVCALPPG